MKNVEISPADLWGRKPSCIQIDTGYMYKSRGKEQWFVKHRKRGQSEAVVWGSGIAPGSFVSVMGTCWARTMRKGLRHLPVVVADLRDSRNVCGSKLGRSILQDVYFVEVEVEVRVCISVACLSQNESE